MVVPAGRTALPPPAPESSFANHQPDPSAYPKADLAAGPSKSSSTTTGWSGTSITLSRSGGRRMSRADPSERTSLAHSGWIPVRSRDTDPSEELATVEVDPRIANRAPAWTTPARTTFAVQIPGRTASTSMLVSGIAARNSRNRAVSELRTSRNPAVPRGTSRRKDPTEFVTPLARHRADRSSRKETSAPATRDPAKRTTPVSASPSNPPPPSDGAPEQPKRTAPSAASAMLRIIALLR